jgi:hypothetical protein
MTSRFSSCAGYPAACHLDRVRHGSRLAAVSVDKQSGLAALNRVVHAGEYRAPADHPGEDEKAEHGGLRAGKCQVTTCLLSLRPDRNDRAQRAAVDEGQFRQVNDYPRTGRRVRGERVLESIEEHHVVVWMLSELAGMDPADERFTAKVTVLIENVRHHVKEEERDWFPQVRKAMGRKALRQLGEELAAAKSSAPSDPLKNISATA